MMSSVFEYFHTGSVTMHSVSDHTCNKNSGFSRVTLRNRVNADMMFSMLERSWIEEHFHRAVAHRCPLILNIFTHFIRKYDYFLSINAIKNMGSRVYVSQRSDQNGSFLGTLSKYPTLSGDGGFMMSSVFEYFHTGSVTLHSVSDHTCNKNSGFSIVTLRNRLHADTMFSMLERS